LLISLIISFEGLVSNPYDGIEQKNLHGCCTKTL